MLPQVTFKQVSCEGEILTRYLKHRTDHTSDSDFIQCVKAGYRPGLRRVGIDEVVLSVSLPTFKLADSISPRALEAWDPRLIFGPWYLTMAITGIRGTCPVLADPANLVPNASEDRPTFRVGLTAAYKPSAEQCLEFARVHAVQRKRPAPKPRTVYWTKDLDKGDGIRDDFENDKSFAFSLSSSLEALMNDCFLPVLALRIKHGIGWAAAEVLHSKLRRLRQGEASTFNRFSTVRLHNFYRPQSIDSRIEYRTYVLQTTRSADCAAAIIYRRIPSSLKKPRASIYRS